MTSVSNSKTASRYFNPFFVMVLVMAMYVVKAIVKITIGGSINSPMIAGDGFHNIADIFEAGAVMLVIWFGRLPGGKDYHFGRKNVEFFASLAIGAALLALCVSFTLKSAAGLLALVPAADTAVRSVVGFLLPAHEPLIMSGSNFWWVVGITAGSALASLFVSRYQIIAGKRGGHASLVADGEETLSDGRIEVVALVGVLGEYAFHAPWLEYLLGLYVAYLIAKTGLELFMRGFRVLLQHSIGVEHDQKIQAICSSVPGVITVRSLKTFQVGHTAVVIVTVVSRLGSVPVKHIKFAVESLIREYVLETDFKDCEVYFQCEKPAPNPYRIALALNAEGAICATTCDAVRFLVCDVEDNAITRVQRERAPADWLEFLRRKRVRTAYVYSGEGVACPPIPGIEVASAPASTPKVFGI